MKAELQEARTRLLAKRAELLGRSAERPLAEKCPDPLDNALAQANTERIANERNHDAGVLDQINRALDAIDAGDYGTCTECEEEIPAKRLAAVPWATMCILCAERAEKKASAESHRAHRAHLYHGSGPNNGALREF